MEYAEVLLVTGHGYGTTPPIQLVEDTDVVVADEESTQACGEAEDFIEGHTDKVRLVLGEIQAVGGDKSSSV